MVHQDRTATPENISVLLKQTINDAQQLLDQQFQLAVREFRQERDKAQSAAISIGAGAGLAAAGGVLGVLGTVHLLHRVTGLPLWLSYGVMGGALGAMGMSLLSVGIDEAASVQLVPPKTAESLKNSAETVQEAVQAEAS